MALSCAVIWSGQSIAVKLAVTCLPPFFSMGIRVALAAPVIAILVLSRGHSLKLPPRILGLVFVNAIWLFLQMGLYAAGTRLTSSVHSIVLIHTFPFFTAITCHYFLPEFPFTLRTIVGLGVAFLGIVVVFTEPMSLQNVAIVGDTAVNGVMISNVLIGDVIVLCAAILVGSKITFVKSLLRSVHPLVLMTWSNIIAIPAFLATGFLLEDVRFADFTPGVLGALAYQAYAVSVIAVWIWLTLVSRHPPNDVTIFRLATPLLGMFFGWLVLSDTLTLYLAFGATLLSTGIYLVTRNVPESRSMN